eukprot:TRINITY_DN2531_c0_g2_i3.p2 TRINITY_DN2531_c0_g2~~TRINITY_DN2531_c0_g2_i3.p2  ORF type:complete len:113 (-),score=28.11 TRINITY_DN2531_c0_g2_i3:412-750(-)
MNDPFTIHVCVCESQYICNPVSLSAFGIVFSFPHVGEGDEEGIHVIEGEIKLEELEYDIDGVLVFEINNEEEYDLEFEGEIDLEGEYDIVAIGGAHPVGIEVSYDKMNPAIS